MKPDFERAKAYVFGRLGAELSPYLFYHSLQHTRDDVLPAAVRLATATGTEAEDTFLLATAALFHDTGFLRAYDDHERHSIAIAREELPEFGYNTAQIDRIAELIAATRMPQRPADELQQLMCDADLDLLGRDDFMRLNRVLLLELRHYSRRLIAEEEWLRNQTAFLESHNFFTPVARTMRASGKARNLALMRAALASLNGSAPHPIS